MAAQSAKRTEVFRSTPLQHVAAQWQGVRWLQAGKGMRQCACRQYDPSLDLEQRRQLAAMGKSLEDWPVQVSTSLGHDSIELAPPPGTDT